MKYLFLFVHLVIFFFCDTAFKETYILKMDLLSYVYGMFLLEQAKTECMVVTFQWKVQCYFDVTTNVVCFFSTNQHDHHKFFFRF